MVVRGRRLVAPGWCRGGAGARSTAAAPIRAAVQRRKDTGGGGVGEVVAAEEERERAAAKKGGAVLGVRVIRTTAPAPPADSLRLTESKRGRFLEGKV
jgi:hypothetical protein